jgi:rod shape-determining protein MreC
MRFKRPLFLISAIIFPLIIGAAAPNLVEGTRTVTAEVIRPILEIQNHFVHFLKTEITHLLEWRVLRKENEQLRLELERLRSERIRFEELEKKTGRLEKLLDLKEETSGETKAARVIARDPSHWAQYIIINRGTHHGVRKNIVLIHSDGLVGKVVASGPHSARAILLTDRGSRVSAMNQRTRDVGLIEGTGSSTFKMTYLDQTSDIEVGDLILSSGLGGIYPKGIPIGTVELVGGEKDHASLYAVVKPFVSFAKLEEVLCVLSQTKD